MTSLKRFGLAALFAIGVMLFTNSPALAIELTNYTAAKDRDHGASGWATLQDAAYAGLWPGDYYFDGRLSYTYWDEVYTARLSVKCEGLTPGKTYCIGPTTYDDGCSFSYVTASDTGAVSVDIPVTITGCTYLSTETNNGGVTWSLVGCSESHRVFVARKQGSRSTAVLEGVIPLSLEH